jgi:hypothetical protein
VNAVLTNQQEIFIKIQRSLLVALT